MQVLGDGGVGAAADWTFESSDGTDTAGSNDLTLVDTDIVAGSPGLALDTLTTGYGLNSAITNELKTLEGTLEFEVLRKSLTKDFYISFTSSGGTTDEIFVIIRQQNISASVSNNITLGVLNNGVTRILYYTTINQMNVINQNYRVKVTADGVLHKIYIDDVLQTVILKTNDVAAFRGAWTGNVDLASVNSVTVGGLNRIGVIVNNGDHVLQYVRVYGFAKN